MPSNRPNLILDEQAFQDLLSAAFTIQEHNARMNHVRPTEIKPQIHPAEPESLCQHCGAPKPTEEPRCQRCGLDEFRPGERMQRKWASMWLMSQDQSLWPERPGEAHEAVPEAHEAVPEVRATSQGTRADLRKKDPTPEAPPLTRPTRSSELNSLLAAPAAPEMSSETPTTAPGEAETIHQLFRRPSLDGWGVREGSATTSERPMELRILPDLASEALTPEHADKAEHTFCLEASADSNPTAAIVPEEMAEDEVAFGANAVDDTMVDDALVNASGDRYAPSMSTAAPPSLRRRLADLRVTLRFHRANLYLGAAILLAACALMWPTGSAPQQAKLSPMERILVAIGVAEAPAPVIQSVGDPNINVWVDPHTALYYCPGEEQYGKTPDGRVSSQHDAQMDRFQPAGRAVCE